MFNSCELYYFGGIYLDQEKANEMSLQKLAAIEFLGLLKNYSSFLGFNDNGDVISISETDLLKMVKDQINETKEICYFVRNNSLIVPKTRVYYGISNADTILSLYDSEIIRNVKLSFVNQNGINGIVDDMTISNPIINEYNKQKKIQKVYSSLSSK